MVPEAAEPMIIDVAAPPRLTVNAVVLNTSMIVSPSTSPID